MNSLDHNFQKNQLYKIRHSMAHILAQAVKQLFPQARLGFGPPTDEGFYYDFDFTHTDFNQSPDRNLKKVYKQMLKILNSKDSFFFTKKDYNYDQALKLCEHHNEPYKKKNIEILNAKGVKVFSFYYHQDFLDLCQGPHIDSSVNLPSDAFSLDRVSGAYWLGSEKNPMLTRIYALCFATKNDHIEYIAKRKLADQYNHQKIGSELELFTFDDRVGKGLALWLPMGYAIRAQIERYVEEVESKYGFFRVHTPCIAKQKLYKTSGHLPLYQQSMFPPMVTADKNQAKNQENENNDEIFYLRPMNCPHHHLIYGHKKRSYRDLPFRIAEYGDVFRYEQSGELSGLLRVRALSINDGHIYCTEDQVFQELESIFDMHFEFFATFRLKSYKFRLSVRNNTQKLDKDTHQDINYDQVTNEDLIDDKSSTDIKFQGDDNIWNKSEKILKEILDKRDIPYTIGYGEAAFYGPKVDLQFVNLLGREETVSTIQLDFLAAKNFSLFYTDENDCDKHPIVIHRAPLSSHERFISYLIEYYRGAFPTWCAPIQVGVVPVHGSVIDYARSINQHLSNNQVRVKLYDGKESFSKKIRINMKKKIPVTVIVGSEEHQNNQVTVRRWGSDQSTTMDREQFYHQLDQEIKNREFYHDQILS